LRGGQRGSKEWRGGGKGRQREIKELRDRERDRNSNRERNLGREGTRISRGEEIDRGRIWGEMGKE
jgi:hypothetical protein